MQHCSFASTWIAETNELLIFCASLHLHGKANSSIWIRPIWHLFFTTKHTQKSQNPQLSIFISQNDMLSAIEMSHFCSSWSNHRASTFEGPTVPLQLSGAWLAPSLHVGAEVSLKIKAFFEMPSFFASWCRVLYVCIYICMYSVIDLSVHLFTYVYLFIYLSYSHFDTM